MREVAEQNYYELLEVSRQAPRSEIVQAYHRAKAAFSSESVATYSLFSAEEAQAIAQRIEFAFKVLVDDRKRGIYDRWLEAVENGEDPPPPDYGLPVATPLGEDEPTPVTADRSPEQQPAPARPKASLPEPPANSDERVKALLEASDSCDGELLRDVREARGLSVEEISRSTKISPMNLRFIEENNYPSLPAPVYLRGFLSQVARCLKLDPDMVVDGYMGRLEDWQAKRA